MTLFYQAIVPRSLRNVRMFFTAIAPRPMMKAAAMNGRKSIPGAAWDWLSGIPVPDGSSVLAATPIASSSDSSLTGADG